jgi:hypothetical protein
VCGFGCAFLFFILRRKGNEKVIAFSAHFCALRVLGMPRGVRRRGK